MEIVLLDTEEARNTSYEEKDTSLEDTDKSYDDLDRSIELTDSPIKEEKEEVRDFVGTSSDLSSPDTPVSEEN